MSEPVCVNCGTGMDVRCPKCGCPRTATALTAAAQAVVEAAVAIETHDELLECDGGQDCNDITNRLADELSAAVRAYREIKERK